MTEADWQRTVTEAATAFGWRWYHTRDSRRSPAGFPDLVLCRGERLIFAELKTDDGRLRTEQSEWIATLMQVHGIEVEVWRPRDWDAVQASLR